MLDILMGKSWCFRNSFQLIYRSYFAMFTVVDDQRHHSVCSTDIKGKKWFTFANEIPPGEPWPRISMTHSRIQQSHVQIYWGHGVVLIVCQSDWHSFWWVHSIRFPHQMKFSSTVIGLVMLWFHTLATWKLWLLPNIKYCRIFSSVCSHKQQ